MAGIQWESPKIAVEKVPDPNMPINKYFDYVESFMEETDLKKAEFWLEYIKKKGLSGEDVHRYRILKEKLNDPMKWLESASKYIKEEESFYNHDGGIIKTISWDGIYGIKGAIYQIQRAQLLANGDKKVERIAITLFKELKALIEKCKKEMFPRKMFICAILWIFSMFVIKSFFGTLTTGILAACLMVGCVVTMMMVGGDFPGVLMTFITFAAVPECVICLICSIFFNGDITSIAASIIAILYSFLMYYISADEIKGLKLIKEQVNMALKKEENQVQKPDINNNSSQVLNEKDVEEDNVENSTKDHSDSKSVLKKTAVIVVTILIELILWGTITYIIRTVFDTIPTLILAVCLMMSYILLLINKVGISDVIVYSVLYAVIEGGIYYVCMYYRSEEETNLAVLAGALLLVLIAKIYKKRRTIKSD